MKDYNELKKDEELKKVHLLNTVIKEDHNIENSFNVVKIIISQDKEK